MRVRSIVVVTVLAVIGIGGIAAPAGAGESNAELRIDAVVNGTPSSQLEISYTCAGFVSVGPTVVDVDATGVVVPSFFIGRSDCSVEVIEQGGMVVSFSCVPQSNVGCNPGNASVSGIGGGNSTPAVITVTFDAAPPTPPDSTAATPLVAAPNTTG